MQMGDIEYQSLKGQVSDAEWKTRVELAAVYRLIELFGWFDLAMPPASARIPGTQHYLFNPAGILFEEITASSLVKVDIEGDLVAETPFDYLKATWYPQQAAHAGREDANWVVHTHDDFATALSARKDKLLPISQTAGFMIADGVAYHEYDGVETYREMVASLQKSLGNLSKMILHNHGLITLGPTPWAALGRMNNLRKACRIQVLAGMGEHLIHMSPGMLDMFSEELRRGPAVSNPWPALLRKLDRLDPSYKE